jgi:hypothetical protein
MDEPGEDRGCSHSGENDSESAFHGYLSSPLSETE